MENSTNAAKIETELSTIVNITQNDYGNVGLNVYQIYPATIRYPFYGFCDVAQDNLILQQINGDGVDWTAITVGRNHLKEFFFYTFTNVGIRYIDIEYINSSGDYVFVTMSGNIYNGRAITNIVNVNRVTWTDISANNNIPFSTILVSNADFEPDKINVFTSPHIQYIISPTLGSGSCIITIPNNYIGIISDVYWYASDVYGLKMIVKDAYNNIKATRLIKNATQQALKFTYIESLKYPLYPGDSVFFASIASGTPDTSLRTVYAMVTLTPY